MRRQGLEYDPDTLRVVACGQQWGGCMAKYPMFISRYLDLAHTPEVRGDLSPEAGFPHKAEFRECIELDRHVHLFLFTMPDGQPMAQLTEGKRAIWEQPSVAILPVEAASSIRTSVDSPNANVQANQGAARRRSDGTMEIDVADGCRPVNVTIYGQKLSYEAFRKLMASARIGAINESEG
jgi:hypothetical protein